MSQQLYIQMGQEYTLCRPTLQSHVFKFSTVTIPSTAIPKDAHPAEVFPTTHSEHWQGDIPQRPPRMTPHPTLITSTFAEFVDTLERWEIDLLQHTTMYVDP
jgi:hypothetical protein